MDQQEPDHLVNAEHISEETLEQSYAELYRNIEHWVEQSEGITNVPRPNVFEDQEDTIVDSISDMDKQ
ncbi:hypothetical protein [Paenibacillus dakarensis]|uniref:hypothetical protein n=1 Tax=Paenibacillus dakarensis TaxID=1527293 RepID=UPI0006D5ABC7|nr:hypothetical protein [Paenibacillus dakarensis]